VCLLGMLLYVFRSGEFSFREKMWEAIRSNLYFFAAALLISIIFIVYMLAAHGSSSAVQFVGLMMAMGNTYGVLLIICLLGTFYSVFTMFQPENYEHTCSSSFLPCCAICFGQEMVLWHFPRGFGTWVSLRKKSSACTY
jgi:hypothetical protein